MTDTTKKSAWKTCSRGHKYRGGRCQYCWKKDKRERARNLRMAALESRPGATGRQG